MTVAELRQKIAEDGEFKTIWKTVRTGVVAAQSRLALRLEKVLSVQRTGYSISRACAFVRSDEYKKKVGEELGLAGCVVPMITVPSYDRRGKKVSGAVIEFDKLPKNVAFEKIKVFSDTIRCHNSELLGPSGIFRKGQAQDRFKYSCQQIKQPFKGEPGSGPNFVEIKKRVDKREADLALKNEMEKRNGGTSVVVTQKTASTLKDADSDDDVQAAPKTSVRSQGQAASYNIRRIGAKRKTTPVEVAESVMASARSSASAFGGSQCGDDTTPSKKSSRFGSFLGPSAGAAAGASVVSLADSSDGNGGEQDTLDIVQILNGAQLGREFRKVFFSVIVNG